MYFVLLKKKTVDHIIKHCHFSQSICMLPIESENVSMIVSKEGDTNLGQATTLGLGGSERLCSLYF